MKKFAILPLAILMVACGNAKPSLVGKWTVQSEAMDKQAKAMGVSSSLTQEFKADGTMDALTKMGPVDLDTPSTYKVDGDKLICTLAMDKVVIKGLPDSAVDMFKKQLAANASITYTVAWETMDTLSLKSSKGDAVKLVRAK